MAGAAMIGNALARRLDMTPVMIGCPEAPLAADWDIELAHARPALRELSARLDDIMSDRSRPLTTLGRCAASLATLPIVARHRPDAMIVWFDAHADSYTPETSTSGYLGGMVLSGASGAWTTDLGANLDFGNIILVGARQIDSHEQNLIDTGLLQLIPVGDNRGSRLSAAANSRPVYVHLDCDVLNPGIVPTEYSVEAGLDLDDLLDASTALALLDVIGLEIAEFEDRWPDGRVAPTEALIVALDPLLKRFDSRRESALKERRSTSAAWLSANDGLASPLALTSGASRGQ